MDNKYSQHNEDEQMDAMYIFYKKKFPSFIVDVGAGDGLFLSNSRRFIEKYDFGGLMIEPSDEPFKDLNKLYKDNKKVKCLKKAMADKIFNYTMVPDDAWPKPHWTINQTVKKKSSKRTTEKLSTIITRRRIREIGILSIDTEGYDTRIITEFIKNCDVRPHLIIIEKKTPGDEMGQRIALAEDYFLATSIQFNDIFLLQKYEKNFSRFLNPK